MDNLENVETPELPEGGSEEGIDTPEQVQEAASYGWKPKDQWQGNEANWVPASEFLRRGKEVAPFLKHSLDRERRKTEQLQTQLQNLQQTVNDFAAYRQKLEASIYKQAMSDLRSKLRTARAEGDIDAAAAYEEQIDTLKENEPKPAPTPPQPNGVDQARVQQLRTALAAWAPNNRWYNKESNPQMVAYADRLAADYVRDQQEFGFTPDPTEVLQHVTNEVRKMFPNKFGTASSVPMFDSGSRGGGNPAVPSGGKGFSSLPADVKSQFDRFFAAGYYGTKKKEEAQAEYFRVYNEG